ncbi:peptidylprolyl isomerase fpr3 [Tritrichomonas musculus]|uniref:Peptidylprolyl isomerase fpr3 n=1 Tax=Tritrichomonas musculus TaxID=1915356 RepID=A0ABR2L5M3_9EUKA
MSSNAESTFFGLVINPNFDYKTLLKDDLLLTNAVIDPDASPEQTARLLIKVDNTRVPLCQLDGSRITCVPLNIQLFSGAEVVFNVAGDSPIHVSGFYTPQNDVEPPDFMPTPGFDLEDKC